MRDYAVHAVGAEAAGVVHALTRAAFGGYGWLDPPSGAMAETEDVVREELAARPGAVAYVDGVAAGCCRLAERDDGTLHVRRLAVDPAYRGRGVASALMRWAESTARTEGRAELRVGVRVQLPDNRAIYEHLGYVLVAEHEVWVELAKPLRPGPTPRRSGPGIRRA